MAQRRYLVSRFVEEDMTSMSEVGEEIATGAISIVSMKL